MKYHEGQAVMEAQKKEQDVAWQAFPRYLMAPWLKPYNLLSDDDRDMLDIFDTKKLEEQEEK